MCCISNYRYTKETESATAVAEARLPKHGCRVARGGGEETRGERGVPPPRWKVTGHPSPVIGDGALGSKSTFGTLASKSKGGVRENAIFDDF